MPAATVRNQVFFSYSHNDAEWLKNFQTMLKPLFRKGLITRWDDTHIRAGQQWRDEIRQALARAKVAVLLVSPDFLASDFIAEEELPHLLDAAEKEGLVIFWVPVRASLYKETEIEKYQAAHDPARPLASLSPAEQDHALVEISEKICEVIKAAELPLKEALPAGPQPLPQETTGARLQFLKGSPVALTRLFASPRIVLGRPKLSADLWLALFPLDDPSNQTLMDGFSQSHAVLRLEEQVKIRDDQSKGGTEINGTALNGRNWHVLQDGDVIGFCHDALELRVRTEPGQWLRLERVNNGPNVENYLFLQGSAIIEGTDKAAIPEGDADTEQGLAELRYQDGGVVDIIGFKANSTNSVNRQQAMDDDKPYGGCASHRQSP